MKIAGGILGFLLVAGLGFVIFQLVKNKGGGTTSTASGGDWFAKPAQSSTWSAAEVAVNSQTRSGRGHF